MAQNPIQRNWFSTNILGAQFPTPVALVSQTYGNNATAQVGTRLAYADPWTASSNVPSGGLIIVQDGIFDTQGTNIIQLTNVSLWMWPTVVITNSALSGSKPIAVITATNSFIMGGTLGVTTNATTNANETISAIGIGSAKLLTISGVTMRMNSDGITDTTTANANHVIVTGCNIASFWDCVRISKTGAGTNTIYEFYNNTINVDSSLSPPGFTQPNIHGLDVSGGTIIMGGNTIRCLNGTNIIAAMNISTSPTTVYMNDNFLQATTNGVGTNPPFQIVVAAGAAVHVGGHPYYDANISGTVIWEGDVSTNPIFASGIMTEDSTGQRYFTNSASLSNLTVSTAISGGGIGTVVGSFKMTGQTATTNQTNILAGVATSGGAAYMPFLYYQNTVAGTGGTTAVTLSWQDDVGSESSPFITGFNLTSTAFKSFTPGTTVPLVIHCASGTGITNIISFSAPTGTPTWNLYGGYIRVQ